MPRAGEAAGAGYPRGVPGTGNTQTYGKAQSLSRIIESSGSDHGSVRPCHSCSCRGPSACAGGGQELQGLKEREGRLAQTVAQVEEVVEELSGFTERLQEVGPPLLTYT